VWADILQFLHDRRHVGRGLVVPFVKRERDALALRIGTNAVADRFSERTILPQQRDFQRIDRLVEPFGEIVDDEIDCGLAVFARGGADLERMLEAAASDDFGRAGRLPMEYAMTLRRLAHRDCYRR